MPRKFSLLEALLLLWSIVRLLIRCEYYNDLIIRVFKRHTRIYIGIYENWFLVFEEYGLFIEIAFVARERCASLITIVQHNIGVIMVFYL